MNRGSEWRKWDLHIHSPYTNIQGSGTYKGVSDEEFINKIKSSDISAVGLTNYFNFKEEEFRIADQLREQGIATFMNLELRFTNINDSDQLSDYHIIFSDKVTKEHINSFLGNLDVTLGDSRVKAINLRTAEDFKNATVNYNDLFNTLDDESLNLKGMYLKAMLTRGHGNSTINKNRTDTVYREILRKTDIIMNSSDFVENLEKDKQFFLGLTKNNKEYVKPLLQSSDSHKLEDIGTKKKQIEANINRLNVYEEGGNYFVKVPAFTWIKADTTFEGLKQIIYEPDERVAYGITRPYSKPDYLVIDRIEYYPGEFILLNEGLNSIIGGRSAGKSTLLNSVADYQKNINVNLNQNHVLDSKYNVIWRDGEINPEREIEFIPQDFMFSISDDKSKLNSLIYDITSRKGLDDRERQYKSRNLEVINNIKINLEKYFKLIEDKNSLIRPEGDEEGVKKSIEKLTRLTYSIRTKDNFSESEEKEYKNKKSRLDQINDRLLRLNKILVDIEILQTNTCFSPPSLENVDNEIKNQLNEIINYILKQSNTIWNKNLNNLKDEFTNEIDNLSQEILDIENSEVYIKGRDIVNKNSELIEYEKQLKNDKELLKEIEIYRDKFNLIDKELHVLSEEISKIYCQHVNNLNEFEELFGINEDGLEIAIKKKTIELTEKIEFLHGKSNNNNLFIDKFNDVMRSFDTEKIQEFLNNIFTKYDLTYTKNKNHYEFIEAVFTQLWFDYDYNIIFQGDEFDQMSQGKKSFVILKMLLDFSNEKKPVLIDQPEDSLDNRAIYNELRTYLLETKRNRQIILVTHNPNIVVGADSENIIVANQDSSIYKNKNKNKFEYLNGSLENSREKDETTDYILDSQGIRQHIFDILEGGHEAFKKRELRYSN